MPSSFRQSGDEVHGYRLKRECSLFGWYTVDGCFLLMCEVLVLLAYSASFDVVRYPLIHIWPLVSFLGLADGFVSTQMASSGMIVH